MAQAQPSRAGGQAGGRKATSQRKAYAYNSTTIISIINKGQTVKPESYYFNLELYSNKTTQKM